jgi:CRISPR-associated endonuclease/helicase Cas3
MDRFLARPISVGSNNSGLLEHSLRTANRAREIAASIGVGEAAYYAGLLHDVGKLNPYYQIFFSSGATNEEYIKAHSIFSALAAYRLLNAAVLVESAAQMQTLFAVAGHHSKLSQFTKSLEYIDHDRARFEKSLHGTYRNLELFVQTVRENEAFKGLAWEKCLRKFLITPRNEEDYFSDGDFVSEFLDFSSVFSALIQADRGSFFDNWQPPSFNIMLNTDVLVRKSSPLSDLRMSFQECVLNGNTLGDNLEILEAPTGIGKTKIFLDIVRKVSGGQSFERVFYFSPLLALTDDFESKLFGTEKDVSVLSQADAEQVLVYNHAFTDSLLKKRLARDSFFDVNDEGPEFSKTQEYFERESFNKPLIVTTTQRLLMVLYSNQVSDKEKFVSFKNSFLIIDEVQTIPKVILQNLVSLLKVLSERYNSKVLLVSATIPSELQGLPKLGTPTETVDRYLQRTAKRIEYKAALDPENEAELAGCDGHTLFMLNTRRKALAFLEKLSPVRPDVLYLSSGIRKCDRRKIIQERLRGKEPAMVVSTQVLEAGVDVSFGRMYREVAPLDSIVQAMGRLNREGERSDPLLTVFRVDGDHLPYSKLEFDESLDLIPRFNSSIDLYRALPAYYAKVSAENLRNKKLAEELDEKMKRLNFDDVWAFVQKHALPTELGDSILVPDPEDWDEVKCRFLSLGSDGGKRKLYRQYAEFMAQLPCALGQIGDLESLVDEELLDKGVLMPKRECLSVVYDSKVGLDKWVKKC